MIDKVIHFQKLSLSFPFQVKRKVQTEEKIMKKIKSTTKQLTMKLFPKKC